MDENKKREMIMKLAQGCNSYMEWYLKAKEYTGTMTYDGFVDYVNMLPEGDTLFKYGEDYSKITAAVRIGNRYVEFRYDDEKIYRGKRAI